MMKSATNLIESITSTQYTFRDIKAIDFLRFWSH